MEARLGRLEDIEAIGNLKHRYAYYIDHGYDADGLAGLFVEDAVWESNVAGTYRGRAEIRRFIDGLRGKIPWALHFFLNPVIEVAPDGQRATGRWYLLELCTMPGVEDRAVHDSVVVTGSYEDTFVKQDGEWRFKRVKAHFHQISNLDQGWVRQRYRPTELVKP